MIISCFDFISEQSTALQLFGEVMKYPSAEAQGKRRLVMASLVPAEIIDEFCPGPTFPREAVDAFAAWKNSVLGQELPPVALSCDLK